MLVRVQPPEPTSCSVYALWLQLIERIPDKGEVDGLNPSETTCTSGGMGYTANLKFAALDGHESSTLSSCTNDFEIQAYSLLVKAEPS